MGARDLDDRDVALTAIMGGICGNMLQYFSPQVKSDTVVVSRAVAVTPAAIVFASSEILTPALVTNAMREPHHVGDLICDVHLRWVSIQHAKHFALIILSTSSEPLYSKILDMRPELRDDLEVALAAVKRHPRQIQHVCSALQHNMADDFIHTLLSQVPDILAFYKMLSHKLQDRPSIVVHALTYIPSMEDLLCMMQECALNRHIGEHTDVWKVAIEKHPHLLSDTYSYIHMCHMHDNNILKWAPPIICDNSDLMRRALENVPMSFAYVSHRLKGDLNMALLAITQLFTHLWGPGGKLIHHQWTVFSINLVSNLFIRLIGHMTDDLKRDAQIINAIMKPLKDRVFYPPEVHNKVIRYLAGKRKRSE